MNPAERVRCNMRRQIELGRGDFNLRVRARFFCYDCVGHDAPGKLRYGKSRPPVRVPGGSGRFQNKCEMKLQEMNPRLQELVALAVLAAFGCGLVLSQGDLLFVAIFGAAYAVTIIEVIRVCGER
jgi:hypothetical protein